MSGLMDLIDMGTDLIPGGGLVKKGLKAAVPLAGGLLGGLGGAFDATNTDRHIENQDARNQAKKNIATVDLEKDKVASTKQAKFSNIAKAASGAISQAASQGAQASLNSGLGGNINSTLLSGIKAAQTVSPVAQQIAEQQNRAIGETDQQNNTLNQQQFQNTDLYDKTLYEYETDKPNIADGVIGGLGRGLMAGNTLLGTGSDKVTQPKIEDSEIGLETPDLGTQAQKDLPINFTGDAPAEPLGPLGDSSIPIIKTMDRGNPIYMNNSIDYSKSARMPQGIEGKNNKGIGRLMDTINSNPVLNSITGKIVNNPTLSSDDPDKVRSNMSGSQTIDDAKNREAYQAKYGKSGVPYNPNKVYY